MGLRVRDCVVFLVVAVCLLSSFTAAKEDPELRQCKQQCRQQRQYGERQRQQCEAQCEEYSKEKQKRRDGDEEGMESMKRWEVQGRRGKGETDNPYVFTEEDFQTVFQNQHGRGKVLPKFTKISNLLKGIENYRVEIFEFKPMTFMLPKYLDADELFFVANGSGTITLVSPNNRESFNIERGHIMKVPAGSNVYLINRDNNERLILVKLIQSVANPGKFEPFFGAGGKSPESVFNALSPEIAEALFKVPRDKLERFFRKQEQGVVRPASKEQIKALSKEGDEGHWPFGGGGARTSNGPFNILRQRPLYSEKFGKLFEVNSDDFKQLRDLDMRVSFANITQGGMTTFHYNTRATKIAVVVNGEGRFQMACPHIARQQSKSGSGSGSESESPVHYEKVSAELKRGTVFVMPAGHPFVAVASKEENLEVVCFEVNAEDDEKVALAGKKSVFKQFEREAKELAFDEKAEAVDEFLDKQDGEFFVEGPKHGQGRGGRADA